MTATAHGRLSWEDLPQHARSRVESLVGNVGKATTSNVGANSRIASKLHVPTGCVFLKGLPSDHRNVHRQYAEAHMSPHVQEISPRVLHHVDTGEWNLLIFEYFPGRHADLRPRSPDLGQLTRLLRKLVNIAASSVPVALPIEKRWARLGHGMDLNLLAGDTLIHTDPNRSNVLIGKTSSVLVDWSLPGKGASWVNIAFVVASLISEGWPPQTAENWAESFQEWQRVNPGAIDVFVTALSRRRHEQAKHGTDPLIRATRRRSAHRAHEWFNYRKL